MKSVKTYAMVILGSVFVLLALSGLVLGLSLVGPDVAAQGTQPVAGAALPRTITVVGEGKVNIKPDMATTNIGVEIMAPTVKESNAEATQTMNAIITVIKANGVADKDIQTSGYNVWVERPYVDPSLGQTTEAKPIYHVSNSLNVVIRDLDKVSVILDAAMEAGANNINGITFSLADQTKTNSEARTEAVTNAQTKAAELAKLNGVELGSVMSVAEAVGGGYYTGGIGKLASFDQGMGGGTPIAPGELETTVQLEITYAIAGAAQ